MLFRSHVAVVLVGSAPQLEVLEVGQVRGGDALSGLPVEPALEDEGAEALARELAAGADPADAQVLELGEGREEGGEVPLLDPRHLALLGEEVAERTVTLYDPGQPWYLVGYPIPSIRHEDYPALIALSTVLSSGRTSRLYKQLVTEQKIAFFVGAFPGFPGSKYPGQMIFYATTARGHSNQEVAAAIDSEIARIKTELVSDEELVRAKTKLRAEIGRAHV